MEATPSEGSVPSFYTPVQTDDGRLLYRFDRPDGAPEYRAYGRIKGGAPGFIPTDEAGRIEEDAAIVDLKEDEAIAVMGYDLAPADMLPKAEEIPEGYAPIEGRPGLYAFETPDGETHYRAYGTTDGERYGFLPVDEEGKALSSAFADPAADLDAMTATSSEINTSGTDGEDAIPVIARIEDPTVVPTAAPTAIPTATPTVAPTAIPTATPTVAPTAVPTATPTVAPTAIPTATPAAVPTVVPTSTPETAAAQPATAEPTQAPPEAKGGDFPWWILLVVLAVLGVGAAVFIGVKKKKQ